LKKTTTLESLQHRLKRARRAQLELRKRLFHLKTLYDISREIGVHVDSQQIIHSFLMMVMGVFGAVRGVIVIIDLDRRTILASSRRGIDAGAADKLRQAAETGAFETLRGVAGVRSMAPGGMEARGIFGAIAALGIARWSSFEIDDHCVAGIGLGEKMSGERYTRDDDELLTTLCNQASVAVRNATAHEEVVRYAAELENSLRRIQILESIRSNLSKFVPKTVQELIEQSPEAPSFEKQEKDVTVVFTDITGYTRLSAELEMHTVNRLVERYFGAFLDEIMKYGGDVNETAGDGLMVIFHDSDIRHHARAAVETALAIQRRTAEINVELAGQSEPIVMHVGINSGIAAVGATKIQGMTGIRWTYTASGPTTNIAARLAALSEGGSIVISEETRNRLGQDCLVENLGFQTLKNVTLPVRAYRLHSIRAPEEPSDRRRRRGASRAAVAPSYLTNSGHTGRAGVDGDDDGSAMLP